ncbi:hypothetical protein CGRA01v4_13316 [Colletotrichum graminicola]|nr:hypothetical protein CGRA01v4_13316 [Colletotrichum graminicola]
MKKKKTHLNPLWLPMTNRTAHTHCPHTAHCLQRQGDTCAQTLDDIWARFSKTNRFLLAGTDTPYTTYLHYRSCGYYGPAACPRTTEYVPSRSRTFHRAFHNVQRRARVAVASSLRLHLRLHLQFARVWAPFLQYSTMAPTAIDLQCALPHLPYHVSLPVSLAFTSPPSSALALSPSLFSKAHTRRQITYLRMPVNTSQATHVRDPTSRPSPQLAYSQAGPQCTYSTDGTHTCRA